MLWGSVPTWTLFSYESRWNARIRHIWMGTIIYRSVKSNYLNTSTVVVSIPSTCPASIVLSHHSQLYFVMVIHTYLQLWLLVCRLLTVENNCISNNTEYAIAIKEHIVTLTTKQFVYNRNIYDRSTVALIVERSLNGPWSLNWWWSCVHSSWNVFSLLHIGNSLIIIFMCPVSKVLPFVGRFVHSLHVALAPPESKQPNSSYRTFCQQLHQYQGLASQNEDCEGHRFWSFSSLRNGDFLWRAVRRTVPTLYTRGLSAMAQHTGKVTARSSGRKCPSPR